MKMSQRGILDDPLFIRIYSLLAGLLILGVVGMCLLLIFAQTYSWLIFLGYVVLGCAVILAIFLVWRALFYSNRRLSNGSDITSGMDIEGLLVFIFLTLGVGVIAYILTVIIRVFIPRPKYSIKIEKIR
jgi:hypothetical protein